MSALSLLPGGLAIPVMAAKSVPSGGGLAPAEVLPGLPPIPVTATPLYWWLQVILAAGFIGVWLVIYLSLRKRNPRS